LYATLKNEVTRKNIIKGLIEEETLDINCNFNKDKIRNFVNRFDQNFEKSIIRHSSY